ncbi:hypothetical protein ACFYNZ_33545 [Streptomyces kebangsaanensis]|uniref:Uncharacterized protein n=1 Tax=Streptomyces kebangsaanensis TaxID=864058 RepID=A0ABW6L2H0_9ACTN
MIPGLFVPAASGVVIAREFPMDIAALITWAVTALGGLHLPAPVVFGHFTLTAIGPVVRIIHVGGG